MIPDAEQGPRAKEHRASGGWKRQENRFAPEGSKRREILLTP